MHILYIIRTHKQTWGVDETSTKRGTRAESTPNSSSTCGSKQQSKIAVVNSSSKVWTARGPSVAREQNLYPLPPNSCSTCVSAVRTYPTMPRGRSSLLKRRAHTLLA